MGRVGAVVTTGIYCRPGCGGRPKASNWMSYPSAAAAEANGFRACLVCRPYRDAPEAPWGGPEVVCRAVSLILDGALDGGTEADIADRLGVSDRHLRRLFAEHVGATPDQLARSVRAHFARRLLDDTDLPLTDVAFTAGFGSVRQFNRVCREVFRFPPRELRRRRRRTDRLVADGGLVVRLPFHPPLDWSSAVAIHATLAIPGVEHVEDGIYRRTAVIDGDPAVLEISMGGIDHLLLRLHLPHWESLMHTVQRARRIFSLDAGADHALSRLRDDPVVGVLVRGRPGARPTGTWDPFEAGVQAVLAGCPAEHAALAEIVHRYGTPVPGLSALGLTHLFPDPARLASRDSTPGGVPPDRWRAIVAFAGVVSDGTMRLDGSERLQVLRVALSRLPGWDTCCAERLAFRIGEPDAFPATFSRLLRGLSKALGSNVSAGQAESLARRWRPLRSHAAAYLIAAGMEPERSALDARQPAGQALPAG
ncbi:MAG: helix-turn-helix domain-containing protein [Acidimicrobiales bacterium]